MTNEDTHASPTPLDRILDVALFLLCVIAIGSLLAVPAESKVVDLVYGAF